MDDYDFRNEWGGRIFHKSEISTFPFFYPFSHISLVLKS
jgi:hypothetical protein